MRIRYKERIRIAKRPFGYHLKRFLRKKYPYVIIAAVILVALGAVVMWANKGTAEKRKAEREYLQSKRLKNYEKELEKKEQLK